jgi:hypothetical protein
MSSTPPGEVVSKHPKATLLTALTSFLIAITQQIKDEDYRKIAVPLVPFAVLLLSIISKTFYKRYKCNNLIKLHKSWISTLENELKSPALTPAREKEILKEITGYQSEIKKLQRDALEIDFN